ncbi:TonB-dependent receptor [Caulobacter sp. 73W]|uniref:TonB-dependent receptor n=1 Tax=Caulobacter sp. 73W TaxID=3161137 RepID=A0AB39KVH0_9CAUL
MRRSTHNRILCAASVSVLALMAAPAFAQSDAGAPVATAQTGDDGVTEVEDIIVTGFRSSLQQALNIKREEAGAVDTILAEDIADFPDLNLAESIQRLPGVTIDREGGQGRTISVRGLGADFTRTRINGLEAQAAYGSNRSRGFDFSMFASELFNSITVRKTQSSEIEEGSLGATVDLQTARPLDYNRSGLTSALSVQGSYNDLSEKTVPRLAGLLSWANEDRTFGALISVAYSERSPISESFNTTRWQSGDPSAAYGAGNNFANCIPCTTAAQRSDVLRAYYPRIPRYTFGTFDEDRLGVTSSIQWRPTERTEVAVDFLWSRFNQEAESPNIEAISFSRAAGGVRETIVRDYAIDASKNILSYGVFDMVDIRSENGFTRDESNFYQGSLNVKHEFSDRLRGRLKVGANKSEARTPFNVAYMFDANNQNGFTYDFRGDDRLPMINYGFDVSKGDRFTLTEWRRSTGGANFENQVAAGALEYDLTPAVTFKAGGEYRTYGFDTFGMQQAVSVLSGADRIVGVGNVGKVVSIDGGLDIPNGSNLSFIVPDIQKLNGVVGQFNAPLVPTYNGIREVEETDKGLFAQADFNTTFADMTVRGNVGVRYARTDIDSSGFLDTNYVTVKNKYDDILPSFNLAIEPRDDLVVRLGAAKVMSRPALGDLTPGGSLSTPTRRVSYGNPMLNPFRATNFDLSVEWYFQSEGLLAAAVFYKDIDSFITTVTEMVPWRSLGLPDSLLVGTPASPDEDFEVTRKVNGAGGSLHGIELQYQQPFTFLPGIGKDFGFIGNFTYVDSEVDYGAYGKNRLTGQSKYAFNTTLYYEKGPMQARVSGAYRSQYLLAYPGGNNNSEEGVRSTFNLDASASYQITDNLTASIEALNLTDAYNDRYVDETNRVSNYRHFGREVMLGMRWKY